jgi:hypothetical protein
MFLLWLGCAFVAGIIVGVIGGLFVFASTFATRF